MTTRRRDEGARRTTTRTRSRDPGSDTLAVAPGRCGAERQAITRHAGREQLRLHLPGRAGDARRSTATARRRRPRSTATRRIRTVTVGQRRSEGTRSIAPTAPSARVRRPDISTATVRDVDTAGAGVVRGGDVLHRQPGERRHDDHSYRRRPVHGEDSTVDRQRRHQTSDTTTVTVANGEPGRDDRTRRRRRTRRAPRERRSVTVTGSFNDTRHGRHAATCTISWDDGPDTTGTRRARRPTARVPAPAARRTPRPASTRST